MVTIWNHLLLWGAFFLFGLAIGFVIATVLLYSGRFQRY